MITVTLMGGLGNQMFQYAAGRNLALKKGCGLELNTYPFRHDRLRDYALGSLNIKASLRDEYSCLYKTRFKYPGLLFASDTTYVLEQKKHRFVFCPGLFEDAKGKVALYGYWQAEKYFSGIRDILLDELSLKEKPSEYFTETSEIMRTTNSVAVHFRRGDYIDNSNVGAICDFDYYLNALAYIEKASGISDLFIFSDEPDWVRSNFRTNYKTSYISSGNDVEDLLLMGSCRNNVIANSSFSWWGAWLNRNNDKIVVAPSLWTRAHANTDDLIPEGWVRI